MEKHPNSHQPKKRSFGNILFGTSRKALRRILKKKVGKFAKALELIFAIPGIIVEQVIEDLRIPFILRFHVYFKRKKKP